ncbi:MAG: DegT/DnrJ/EryC1/StrS family aminotransferase [Woeseiaceae bacterium]
MTAPFIPFALPSIGQEEVDAVSECLLSGWLTSGPKMRQFEEEFASAVDAKFALAVNSATAGLHLSVDCIGLRAGDKVLTTPFTFTATAEVVRYMGADPKFVDIDRDTLNLDPNRLQDSVNDDSNVKAIMPVHYAGQACDMNSITDIARSIDARVIEDAAHSFPATYAGKKIGSIGDLTVFSFYATKTIATGEGGMVTTDNEQYAERIRCMRLHGISKDVFNRYQSTKPSWYYEIIAPGFKYNMPDTAAAIGIEQLKKAEAFRSRREAIAQRYFAEFGGLPCRLPAQARPDDVHAWHLFVLQLELESLSIDRDRFIELMAEQGIGTSVHFIPLHLQPYWRDRYDLRPDDFPVANDVFKRVVSLPIYPSMTDEAVERVVAATRGILLKAQK